MASFAAITTVISASGGMAAVQKGLQKLTPGARKTMFDRLWAVLYTFLFEGLMLVAIVVQSLSPILRGLAGLLPLHTWWAGCCSGCTACSASVLCFRWRFRC